jgi:hypothetical protein
MNATPNQPTDALTFLHSEVAECDSITLDLQMQRKSIENQANNMLNEARQKVAAIDGQIASMATKKAGYQQAIKELANKPLHAVVPMPTTDALPDLNSDLAKAVLGVR